MLLEHVKDFLSIKPTLVVVLQLVLQSVLVGLVVLPRLVLEVVGVVLLVPATLVGHVEVEVGLDRQVLFLLEVRDERLANLLLSEVNVLVPEFDAVERLLGLIVRIGESVLDLLPSELVLLSGLLLVLLQLVLVLVVEARVYRPGYSLVLWREDVVLEFILY